MTRGVEFPRLLTRIDVKGDGRSVDFAISFLVGTGDVKLTISVQVENEWVDPLAFASGSILMVKEHFQIFISVSSTLV